MKKKVVSLLVMSAVITSVFIGCGDKSSSATQNGGSVNSNVSESEEGSKDKSYSAEVDMEGDPYTVAIQVVTLPGTEFEGEEEREAAINAIIEPQINCNVDIQEVWISEIANTTSMAVAGNEKVDLIHVATVNKLSSLVGSDLLLDMNEGDLLQKRGTKLVELFGDQLKAGEVAGQQLAVPAKVFNANANGIFYNKTLTDAAGITIPEKITFEELEKILYEFHEKNPDVMPYYSGNGEMNLMQFLFNYESFGNESSYGIIWDSGENPIIENLYETEKFKDFVLTMHKWTKDGIQPGNPTDTNTSQDYFNSGALLTCTATLNPEQIIKWRALAEVNGFEVGATELVPATITNASVTEYMWGIASNSERPDKAMDFLNVLYSNAEVANILQYGISGVNYEFVGDSQKVIEINGSYMPLFYCGGDASQMYIQSPGSEDYIEKMTAFESTAKVSPTCYYMFDDSNYQTEASVINSTILEYMPRLLNGMCESEEETLALLEEFNQKLDASGINEVIAGNQEQLAVYLETK